MAKRFTLKGKTGKGVVFMDGDFISPSEGGTLIQELEQEQGVKLEDQQVTATDYLTATRVSGVLFTDPDGDVVAFITEAEQEVEFETVEDAELDGDEDSCGCGCGF